MLLLTEARREDGEILANRQVSKRARTRGAALAPCRIEQQYRHTDHVAADTTADIEIVRSIAEAERKAVVADNMRITSAEAEKFWPVYNEYREEARKVGDKRVKVIRDLANEFETLDDARAEELLREVLDFQADRVKLRKSYVKKFKKAIPPKKTVRFFQIDSKLDTIIDFALATEIPLVN